MSASGLQVQMETQIQVHTYILREHQTKYINIDIGLLHTIHGSNVNIKTQEYYLVFSIYYKK